MRVNVINDIKALAIVSTKNNKGYIIKLNQETKIILEMKDINKVNHFYIIEKLIFKHDKSKLILDLFHSNFV